ncbi:Cyclic pyranopterin monophosphate synthase [Golovinomyces cichoracearum]|uniref:Cyclic pyranopterin monophosphate synthase n=1 Tax=Golovinomyces cichoracearum TaxID=62708 RepID=A0A420J6Y0_9PEZI|nr:Cyclic pyranopterin monophosphate synthase [Golovinomyces cichoracearum]
MAIEEFTHFTLSGTTHVVSISHEPVIRKTAVAVCFLSFPNPNVVPLIRSIAIKKGNALSVARTAAIMTAKKTSDLILLFHPIALTHLSENDFGKIEIPIKVECFQKSGAEMEAMTAASIASLTIFDMYKSVGKGMRIGGLGVIRKEGDVSGPWSKDEQTELPNMAVSLQ